MTSYIVPGVLKRTTGGPFDAELVLKASGGAPIPASTTNVNESGIQFDARAQGSYKAVVNASPYATGTWTVSVHVVADATTTTAELAVIGSVAVPQAGGQLEIPLSGLSVEGLIGNTLAQADPLYVRVSAVSDAGAADLTYFCYLTKLM